MKVRKLLLSTFILLCFNVSAQTGANNASVDDSGWGLPVSGLQLSLSEYQSNSATIPKFRVQFRNVGKQDFVLNLGRMLANGRVQLPDRISLELTDASGKTRKLSFLHTMFVAGRVDDYLIPLKTDATYSIAVGLDQFYSRETIGNSSPLFSGATKVVASLDGVGAMNLNSDTPGIALMEFWTGKVRSNMLVVQR
jgi:hypothetical protein